MCTLIQTPSTALKVNNSHSPLIPNRPELHSREQQQQEEEEGGGGAKRSVHVNGCVLSLPKTISAPHGFAPLPL